MKFKIYTLILVGSIFLLSCKNETIVPDVEFPVSSLELRFNNQVNNSNLELTSGRYLTSSSDTFSLSGLKYIISNIRLFKNDELVYTELDSYHLIDEKLEDSKLIILDSVPFGEYDRIDFALGVDSTNDNGQANAGDLSSNNGLFWIGWGSYIYFRFDGSYHNGTSEALAFHIGGKKAYQEQSFDLLLNEINVRKDAVSSVYFNSNVEEIFESPNTIDISALQNVAMAGTAMDSMSENYKTGMFEIDKIINL